MQTFAVGVDLGTGGLRAVAVTPHGEVLASAGRPIETQVDGDRRGQRVADWVAALEAVLDAIFAEVQGRVMGIAVASTSGTVACGDTALLYSDGRARDEAARCSQALGRPLGPSCGLPKQLWLARHQGAGPLVHAVDVLNAWLLGRACATDFTSALKSGYEGGWPEPIFTVLGLPREHFPAVVSPSADLGAVRPALCRRWGLDGHPRVLAGATDANAAFYASGAVRCGQWATALGSTLAIRGETPEGFDDPTGRLYRHRHPDGGFVAAGASNAGFLGIAGARFEDLDPTTLPQGAFYPLAGRGERMPFVSDEATAFWCGTPCGDGGAAFGLALIERWCHALAASMGAPPAQAVFSTGGGARHDGLCQLRANVLGVPVHRARFPDACFGAAVLAVAGARGAPVATVAHEMVRIERTFEPQPLPGVEAWLDALRTAVENRAWRARPPS